MPSFVFRSLLKITISDCYALTISLLWVIVNT
nr:MAG TPA: hypothetical protein [Caudoviricetes sp.]